MLKPVKSEQELLVNSALELTSNNQPSRPYVLLLMMMLYCCASMHFDAPNLFSHITIIITIIHHHVCRPKTVLQELEKASTDDRYFNVVDEVVWLRLADSKGRLIVLFVPLFFCSFVPLFFLFFCSFVLFSFFSLLLVVECRHMRGQL